MIVRYTRSAQADVQSIFEFIAQNNPRAAKQTVLAIEQAINRLSFFPRSGRNGAIDNTRELVVSGLPYIVVYVVEPDEVKIIAVFHASQNRPRA